MDRPTPPPLATAFTHDRSSSTCEADLAPHSRWNHLIRSVRGHVRITGFGLGVLALGLLIWARLMLVTNHPRIAVAEPSPPLHVQNSRQPAAPALVALPAEPEPYPADHTAASPSAIASHGE